MKILSIQYLRGIAALMVVAFHLQPQLERMGLRQPPGDWLMSGVDIFFVISGFIMWWTTRRGDVTPAAFARRRLHRIVPLYWALTTFYLLVLLVAPQLMQTGKLDPSHAVASYLFFPWPHPVVDVVMPMVTPGWTLNYEMLFYGIFALALFAPPRSRMPAVSGMIVALAAAGKLLQPQSTALDFYTSSILLEFLFGVWIGALVGSGRLLSPKLAPVLAAAAVMALPLSEGLPTQETRVLFWGLPAAALIYATVSWELQRPWPRWPVPLLLGNASYSIYLSQQLSLSAVGQVWRRLVDAPFWVSAAGFAVVGFTAAVAAGLACYFLVERPLSRLTAPLLFPERKRPPASPVPAARSTPAR